MSASPAGPHLVVAGGGYVGMYTALGLQRRLRSGEGLVTVIDPRSAMTYQPFLPEAAAGNLEPRHVVVPLRKTLHGCEVITGRVTGVSTAASTVTVSTPESDPYELHYDELVVAFGSVSRTLPVPGLRDNAMAFHQVEEAIALRNQVLDRLDSAASVRDPAIRARALSFVFVGGGYAGIEALGEIEDMARFATRYYPTVDESDLRFILVEATDHILPEVGRALGRYTVERLRRRGIDVRLNTRLDSCVDRHVVLSDGTELDADTIVWTAGVKASPALRATDLPLDDRGRVRAHPDLRVDGVEHVWTAGDNAAVPDLTNPGAFCSPTAQHAVRQARVLAANIVRSLRGEPLHDYRHRSAGSLASLGLYKGVAQVYGVRLRGFPAWFMHRTYHMSRLPTFNRKVRVVLDWTTDLFFRRDIVSLGTLHHPREEFSRASSDPPAG
ncbi:MAG TPA: NAD(P)/FAD-dependent oxidoreductase [Nocardioidaceae bacterium]|nr:NAD(P)/FAD-dependent oxidoreductase [Nocardioidaceae bacterium]